MAFACALPIGVIKSVRAPNFWFGFGFIFLETGFVFVRCAVLLAFKDSEYEFEIRGGALLVRVRVRVFAAGLCLFGFECVYLRRGFAYSGSGSFKKSKRSPPAGLNHAWFVRRNLISEHKTTNH